MKFWARKISIILIIISLTVSTTFAKSTMSKRDVIANYTKALELKDCSEAMQYCGGELFSYFLMDNCETAFQTVSALDEFIQGAKITERVLLTPVLEPDGSTIIGFEDTYSNGKVLIHAFRIAEMGGDYKIIDHEIVALNIRPSNQADPNSGEIKE